MTDVETLNSIIKPLHLPALLQAETDSSSRRERETGAERQTEADGRTDTERHSQDVRQMTLPVNATTDFRSDDPRDRCPPDAARICRVCGDAATGMYFGALVCVPCKTFFLRYAGDGFSYECKYSKTCDITTATRTQCKFCRYQKCLRVGMCRRVRPAQIEAQDGQQLCVVCQDVANGVHFGVLTCEGCKKFFRRGLVEQRSYRCRNDQNCSINPSNRNACRFCRFKKCLKAGMSREAIVMGRPSKMSVYEGSHAGHRPPHYTRDRTDLMNNHPSRLAPTSLPYSPSTFRPALEHHVSTVGSFPSWMEDEVWRPTGPRNPLTTTTVKSTVRLDDRDGDKSHGSGGSVCPDSTIMVRDETDLFPAVGVDFTRSFTSGEDEEEKEEREEEEEEEYLHDWTDGHAHHRLLMHGGFDPPVAPMKPMTCKMEVMTSDEDEDGGLRCPRYDTGGSTSDDWILPTGQGHGHGGCFDLAAAPVKYCSTSGGIIGGGKLDDIQFVAGIGCGHEDVSSTDIVVGGRTSGCGTATSGFLNRTGSDVRIGSPSVSSSSCPLDLMKTEKVEVQAGQGLAAAGESTVSGVLGAGCSCQTAPGKGSLASERSEVRKDWRETCHAGSLDANRLRGGGGSTVEEVGNQCWQTIKGVIPAYHRFVNSGTVINGQLKQAYQSWKKECPRSDCADELSLWIQSTVVPAYTTISVTYCKSLPDFTTLCAVDQRTLIAGGQSESRILVAALHWYDATDHRFRNFLSWREDSPLRPDAFKTKLRDFADRITRLHLDPIEAALLNAVGIFSTDYPNLNNVVAIEGSRAKILTTMKSYIASNNSAPGERLETLFRVLREAQVLGAEHVALTNTRTLGLPTSKDGTAEGKSPASPPGHTTGTAVRSDRVVTVGQFAPGTTGHSETDHSMTTGHSETDQSTTSGQFASGPSTMTSGLTADLAVTAGGQLLTAGVFRSRGESPSAVAKSPIAELTGGEPPAAKRIRCEYSPARGEMPADSLQ